MRAEGRTFRDHAIAAASPRIGVALNRDVDAAGFQRQWRRSIVHEFGHVVGIGHSANRDDVMFSGGRQETPTASDLAACNQAIERRYGVRSAAR
jgi:predicted Zn-dependent protease